MDMTEEAKAGMIDMILRVAKEFGLPVVLLGVVVYLFREVAVTVHSTVLIPVVQSHTKFIDSTQETLREISKTQERQAETLHDIAEGQRDIQRAITVSRTVETTVKQN